MDKLLFSQTIQPTRLGGRGGSNDHVIPPTRLADKTKDLGTGHMTPTAKTQLHLPQPTSGLIADKTLHLKVNFYLRSSTHRALKGGKR